MKKMMAIVSSLLLTASIVPLTATHAAGQAGTHNSTGVAESTEKGLNGPENGGVPSGGKAGGTAKTKHMKHQKKAKKAHPKNKGAEESTEKGMNGTENGGAPSGGKAGGTESK